MNAVDGEEAKAGEERKILECVKKKFRSADFHTPKKEMPISRSYLGKQQQTSSFAPKLSVSVIDGKMHLEKTVPGVLINESGDLKDQLRAYKARTGL